MAHYAIGVEKYVQAHINEKITLEMLSENAFLSKYHFSREFKKETGISPMQYVTQIKVDDAENLLLNSDKKILEIAEHIGYEPGRFCNLFKEFKGISPSAYRAENQLCASAV